MIKIIDIRPEISRFFSPIGRNIEFPQAHCFSERKPERNWQYREVSSSTNDYLRQHDTSYYQPQPAICNQRQRYRHDRTKQQAPFITDYDREKWKNVVFHSGISSPDIKQSPIIPLGNEPYYINKPQLFLLVLH